MQLDHDKIFRIFFAKLSVEGEEREREMDRENSCLEYQQVRDDSKDRKFFLEFSPCDAIFAFSYVRYRRV